MCRDRGDAEDATQEALVAIVRGLPRYDGRAAFTTWSYRVATNACLDQLRRRARRPQPTEMAELGDGSEPGTHPGSRSEDPGDRAVAAEHRTRLQRALADLPEEFRLPVVLRDVADLDYAEIAELLDLAPGTVRSRISRGRARLADALEDLRPAAGSSTAGGSTGGNPGAASDVRPGEPT